MQRSLHPSNPRKPPHSQTKRALLSFLPTDPLFLSPLPPSPAQTENGPRLDLRSHQAHIAAKIQGFFVDRETDGGGIHGSYSLCSTLMATPRELQPGNIRVDRRIGGGNFGEVFSGELLAEGLPGPPQRVALKVLGNATPGDEEIRAFLAEAAVMAQF